MNPHWFVVFCPADHQCISVYNADDFSFPGKSRNGKGKTEEDYDRLPHSQHDFFSSIALHTPSPVFRTAYLVGYNIFCNRLQKAGENPPIHMHPGAKMY